jgi:Leucine-rich repeat (LRR) protein
VKYNSDNLSEASIGDCIGDYIEIVLEILLQHCSSLIYQAATVLQQDLQYNLILLFSIYCLLCTAFPVSPHWTTIKELYLDSNQLKEIPKSLSTLAHLEVLSLSHNQISHIPLDEGTKVRHFGNIFKIHFLPV